MASEVKTNKVSPATSTTLSVGDSGDTLALAVDSVTGFNVGSDAAGDVLYNDGTDYTRLAKPGTPAGEVLTFATSATAPSWVAAAAAGFAGVHADASSGSETYTVPTDITKLLVIITGGGGGGGNGGTGNGYGGGGGGTVMARVTVVADDTITLAVGAGGANGTSGSAGGDSTFTHATGSGSGSMSTITAPGGIGGPHSTLIGAPVAPTVGANNEGIAIRGGWPGTTVTSGNFGGGSFWGAVTMGAGAGGFPGQTAYVFGAGGGGGSYSTGGGSNVASSGADGVCFIMEFK